MQPYVMFSAAPIADRIDGHRMPVDTANLPLLIPARSIEIVHLVWTKGCLYRDAKAAIVA
jgi:hypothetical protein